jgi:hypothetical protein
MLKSRFNHGFYVFSKKADIIPLKDKKQTTPTKAFEKILNDMGIPKNYIF